MIKVTNEVGIYELEDVESSPQTNKIIVESHWNRNTHVILIVDGKRYTIIADDLEAAIDNAKNINRY